MLRRHTVRHLVAAGIAATLALATTAADARAKDKAGGDTDAGRWDMIAFEMHSWGRPVRSWSLTKSGEGSWTETVSEKDSPFNRFDRVWHELVAGEGDFGKLSGILGKLPRPAPDYATCTNRITDQPYGTVRLTRGATTIEISYNAGCMDGEYVAFLNVLKEADQLVANWGRKGPVLRTEKSE